VDAMVRFVIGSSENPTCFGERDNNAGEKVKQDDSGTVLVQAKRMSEEVGASPLEDLLYYFCLTLHSQILNSC
jgi:hypothetical protein